MGKVAILAAAILYGALDDKGALSEQGEKFVAAAKELKIDVDVEKEDPRAVLSALVTTAENELADAKAALAAEQGAHQAKGDALERVNAELADARAAGAALAAGQERLSDLLAGFQAKRDALVAALAPEGDEPLAADADPFALAIAAIGEVAGARAAIERVQADFEEVARQRDELTKQLAEAIKKPAVQKAPKPPKPRAVGPLAVDKVMSKVDLLEAVRKGPLTIVFSNGTIEIDELEPIIADPTAWQDTPAGVLLRESLHVTPDRLVSIAGFGLLDGAGKQIGWCGLMQPLRLAANQTAKLDRQIVF